MTGWRKVIVAVAGLCAAVALQWAGRLDAVSAGLIGTIVSAYLAANTTHAAVTGQQ